jgi:DNA polymerase V
MFALIDCNNFYVSCHRLFRPDLLNKPVLVLSNNDGCVIARSNEVKALGVKMGEPFFNVKTLCDLHQVTVFSTNFALYGDISQRVMQEIELFWHKIEIYSIDEAFLTLDNLSYPKAIEMMTMLQKIIFKHTGIPTSVGIGHTKTLAKLSNHIAKNILKIPVFLLQKDESEWLNKVPVQNVWGVGRRSSNKLHQMGIFTALDLAKENSNNIRKFFNVMLMRTVLELNGAPCFFTEEVPTPKSIIASRTFNHMQTEEYALYQSITRHCMEAYRKLRAAQLKAQHIQIDIRTNTHRMDLPSYQSSATITFTEPTDDIRQLMKASKQLLSKIYKKGYQYKKTGVMLLGLSPKLLQQFNLFEVNTAQHVNQSTHFLNVIDSIHTKFGKAAIQFGVTMGQPTWTGKSQSKAPSYTTNWAELPIVYAH